jgi:hypothetical protein
MAKEESSLEAIRQGDPLSPLLFNLVADALSAMLFRASSAGVIQSLVPPFGGRWFISPAICSTSRVLIGKFKECLDDSIML